MGDESKYQSGPPSWVYLAALVGFVTWFALLLVAVDPWIRRVLARLTGVEHVRGAVKGNSALSWSAVGDGHGFMEFAYWVFFWFLALGLPILIGLTVLYFNWKSHHTA